MEVRGRPGGLSEDCTASNCYRHAYMASGIAFVK